MATDYKTLVIQFEELTKFARSGVVGARKLLPNVIQQLDREKIRLGKVEPKFVISKPGYTAKMIFSLIAQARIGSNVATVEIQKYADWLIEQKRVGQKIDSVREVPLCNTGTLSDTPENRHQFWESLDA